MRLCAWGPVLVLPISTFRECPMSKARLPPDPENNLQGLAGNQNKNPDPKLSAENSSEATSGSSGPTSLL